MGNTSSFKQRYKYWKETGELPYKNGIKQDLESNKVDDSPVKSSIPYPMLTSSDYDDARAYELGYFDEAGANGHLYTRDYETGRYLKKLTHPTVGEAMWDDMNNGYDVINKNGQYYSKPNFILQKINKLPGYDDGKDGDNIFRYTNSNGGVRYVYQDNPDAEEVPVRPLNTIFPDPAQWTFTDDNGRFYTPRRTTPTNTAELNPDNRTGFERALDNYIGEAFNTVPKGYHTLPAIGAAAFGLANPALGELALTSGFGAHGLSKWMNGEVNGPLDAAMTALEITPFGRLVRPMWNAGKEGLQYTTKAVDNATRTPKVNWNADNWFKTISGRNSYSAEEASELASHVPEYRAIEQRLFNEGKLALDSNGNAVVVGSEMSPQEYIMRQSEAFQKMNSEHHYVGVSKDLRNNFENEARDPATINRYEVWTDRKSPKNVEEYAQSRQGGYTNDSQIEDIERQMAIREENYALHKEQLKWKLDHNKISQEIYDRDLAALEDMYNWKQKVAKDELKVLKRQKAIDPFNGGKVFDITYPKEAVLTPIINAENNQWSRIPFDNVVRDAPSVVTHYKQRPYSNELQTDQIVNAARRNGYGVTHIDNVMDTYNGTMLNETIIGRDTPIKSVLGNTGSFDIESPNRWKLYRSLIPPFLGLGAAGALYRTPNKK